MKQLSLSLAILLTVVATAQGYRYDSVSGYYVNNGSYYRLGQHYYSAGYYGGLYCSAGYYPAYIPVAYTPPVSNTTINFSAANPDWKERMIDGLVAKHKEIDFQTALKLSGLTLPGANYGYNGYVPQQMNYAYAITSTTGFGYPASAIQDLYRSTDVDALGQRVFQGLSETNGLVKDYGQAAISFAAEVSERQQRTAAMVAFLRSLDQPKQTQVQFGQQTGPAAIPQAQGDVEQRFVAVATSRCASCHDGAKSEGGFRLADIAKMSHEGRMKVLSRVHPSADKSKRMPKDGQPLSQDEYRAFGVKLLGL